MMKVPTVMIKTENGPVLINEFDYDDSVHELHSVDPDAGTTPDDGPNEGTNAWYKLQLDADGIAYPGDANKATLKMIYDGSRG